ncbi:MAG: hypothetical protein ABW185_26015 [Sedimenticola sp.]
MKQINLFTQNVAYLLWYVCAQEHPTVLKVCATLFGTHIENSFSKRIMKELYAYDIPN